MCGNSQFQAGRPTTTTAGITPTSGQPSREFPPPRASHPNCRSGDLQAVQPRQVQHGSRLYLLTSAGLQAVVETIPPLPAHVLNQWPRELQQLHTTLRRSNFEHAFILTLTLITQLIFHTRTSKCEHVKEIAVARSLVHLQNHHSTICAPPALA